MKFTSRIEIDLKSVLIGALLCLAVVLLSANSNGTQARYQCSAASESSTAVFVTDTLNGHTWKLDIASNVDYGTPKQRKSFITSVTPTR